MSGKKASEVNSLLNNGKSIRRGSMNVLNTEYEKTQSAATSLIALSKEEHSCALKISTAEKEFPNAAKKINSGYDEVVRAIDSIAKNINGFQNLKDDYNKLLKSYEQVDKEADKVSNDLKKKISSQSHSDAWYCDDEYRSADKVADKYRELKTKSNDLVNRLASESKNLEMQKRRLSGYYDQLDKFKEEAKDLEDKAKAAAKLRADAKSAKKTITEDFNKIDIEKAQRFMRKEYNALKKRIEAFLESDDKQIVSSVSTWISEIKQFSTELENTYAEYIRQKESVKAALSCAKDRMFEKVYNDPKAEYSDVELEKYNLVEFLDKFCKAKYTAQIHDKLSEAEKLFNDDSFENANIIIQDVGEIIDEAVSCAVNELECRTKTIENALRIEMAMEKLCYDVDVLDAEGDSGGYEIVCTAEDERIVFENMIVDSDGHLTFGIDHTESIKGTCGSSWDEIRKSLAESNVFVEDITKNGVSIHSPNNLAKRAASQNTRVVNSH